MKSGRWALLALVLTANSLVAQRVSHLATLTMAPIASTASASTERDPIPTTAVVLTTEPNAVRVVAIPVPIALRGAHARFVFVRQSTLEVIGRVEGTVTPEDASRPIALGVTVPPDAAAGPITVGVMRFSCDSGCESVDVPVVLEVQTRSALRIDPPRPLVGSHAGGRARTDVTVGNAGNAAEEVSLAVELPNDWRSRVLVPMPIRVEAGATTVIPVEIMVSNDAGMGDYGAQFRASTASGAVAHTEMTVRVDGGQGGVVGWRPIFTASAAVARDESGQTATAFGADLAGEVLPDVHANGHASFINDASSLSGLTQRSLGRLGATGSNSYLMLNAPNWGLGAGTVGVSTAGLSGNGLWGNGGSFHAEDDTWRGSGLAVMPTLGGHYYVTDVARKVGPVWTGVVASDLEDNVGSGRSARTLAGDFTLPWKDGSFELQAGQRRADSVQGPAFLARFDQRTRTWGISALAAHVPGGAMAFANAQDQLELDGFRQLSKSLSLGAGYWKNSDPGTLGNAPTGSIGWSVAPQLSLGPAGALALEATSSQWNGETALGAFGNSDRELRASWMGTIAQVQTQLGVAHGVLGRSASVANDVGYDLSADRLAFVATASAHTRLGSWQLDATSAVTGAGVGVPSHQMSFGGTVDEVPLVAGRAYLRGQMLAYYLGTSNSVSLSQVVGVDLHIADGYTLSLDAERSGEDLDPTGRPQWVVSTRIRRAMGVPPLRSRALRGVVYADLNNNGKRDRGEPGVADAVVRANGTAVTTDADGRFALSGNRGAQMDVDPRSLPAGWIVAPRSDATDSSNAGSLAVIPTSPVDVFIRLDSAKNVDTTNVRLDRAVLVLTDSAGRRWTGAPNAAGLLRFDALPPGAYEVSADLSRVGEPLALPDRLPMVRVEGGNTPLSVVLIVGPRKIRIVQPPGRVREIGNGVGHGDDDPR